MKKVIFIVAVVMTLIGIVVFYTPATPSANKPNKAPEPTTPAVTSPAAQEPRQS